MNKEQAQYIDKDALVAKIKRRFDECSSSILKHYDACKEAKALELGKILTIIDTLEVKELPIWEKVSPDTGQTTLYRDGDKSYLERFGYRIDLKDLDKLPKKNSTHRTPADIESAMQEMEAKSEAYTNAHSGERADDVLSQMRGEPVCEDLEKAANDYGVNIRKGYPRIMDETDKYIYNAFKAGAQWRAYRC